MSTIETTKTIELKKDNRDYFFDNLRALLIFCVVLCHGIETARGSSESLALFHELVLCFVMPMFVFVTGYFAKSQDTHGSPKRMKIINLIVLYIICQIIKMIIFGQTSFIRPSYANWYIVAIIIWYYILPTVSKAKVWVALVIAIFIAVTLGSDPYINEVLQLSRVIGFLPYFILGYACNTSIAKKLQSRKMQIVEAGILIICIGVYSLLMYGSIPLGILHYTSCYSNMGYSFLIGAILKIIMYAFSVCMCVGICAIIPRKKCFFSVIGKRTLPIYIFHTIIYSYIICYTDILDQIANAHNTLLLFIVFSLVMTVICANKLFDKMLAKLMGIDFGFLLKNKY